MGQKRHRNRGADTVRRSSVNGLARYSAEAVGGAPNTGASRCSKALGRRPLIDDFIGPKQNRLRDGQAKGFGATVVDDELKFGRAHDRKIAWLLTF